MKNGPNACVKLLESMGQMFHFYIQRIYRKDVVLNYFPEQLNFICLVPAIFEGGVDWPNRVSSRITSRLWVTGEK